MVCMLAQRHVNVICPTCPTLVQRCANMLAQRANLRWANVVCQRWANGVANQNTPLAQRYHAIWDTVTNPLLVVPFEDNPFLLQSMLSAFVFEIIGR